MYRFNEYNKQTYRLTPQKSYKNNEKPLINEWNLALTGLIASILVILTKIISNNCKTCDFLMVNPFYDFCLLFRGILGKAGL